MKDFRNSFLFILVFGLKLILINTMLTTCSKQRSREEINIGWIGPLSGDAAIYGEMVKRGTDLALETINAYGGIKGKKIKIFFEDDQLNPQKGVAALMKLHSMYKLPVVIQAIGSTVMLAEAPIAEREGVVLISPTCTSDKIRDAGDYVFRISPTDSAQGSVIADLSYNKLVLQKAAILFINNEYGSGLFHSFKEAYKTLGGDVLFGEAYDPGNTDFRTNLVKIKNLNVDLVILFSHFPDASLILRQAKELNILPQFIGPDGCFAPDLIRMAGVAAENFIVTNMEWNEKSDKPNVRNFVKRFRERFGKSPDIFGAYGYDCVMVIAEAMRRGGFTSNGIKLALYKISNFEGVTGTISFDDHGDVTRGFDIYIVKNGTFVRYEL